MTKYKENDTLTFRLKLSKFAAKELSDNGYPITFCGVKLDLVNHDPAPEPIVQYCVLLNKNSCGQICVSCGMNDKIDAIAHCYKTNGLGVIKLTITGNDFTVEKVTG